MAIIGDGTLMQRESEMGHTLPKVRATGDIVSAAIWNTVLTAGQIDELYEPAPRPMAFTAPEIVECVNCGQLNQVVMEKLYKGCGACGAPFEIEQFKGRVTGGRIPSDRLTLVGEAGPEQTAYWVIGEAGHSWLGVNTVLGF